MAMHDEIDQREQELWRKVYQARLRVENGREDQLPLEHMNALHSRLDKAEAEYWAYMRRSR